MSTTVQQRNHPADLAEDLRARLTAFVLLLRRRSGDRLPVTPVQAQVLLGLVERGPQRVSDLADAEGVSHAAMSVLLDRLERRRWIRRQADRSDRRAVQVAITAAGRDVLAKAAAARTAVLAERLAGLSSADRAAIAAALPALGRLLAVPSGPSSQPDQRRPRE